VPLAYRMGGVGLCVAELQHALGVAADGIFGPQTREAVERVERSIGREPSGDADAAVFSACGLEWPDEFRRCLTLTSAFEGTGFGDCNPTDIDGAGVTFGVIGFTTEHGEVQALVTEFLRHAPEALEYAPRSFRRRLEQLLLRDSDRHVWERVMLDPMRRVRPEVRASFAAWGNHPQMRELQVRFARERCWHPAAACAKKLGVDTPAGRGLLFDVWVQNGGWRAAHETHFARLMRDRDAPPASKSRLEVIAIAVAAESRAPWRADVLGRKLVFARGWGIVHRRSYDLTLQALA